MGRRWFVLLFMLLAACSKLELAPMPEAVAEWRRGTLRTISTAEMPALLRDLGAASGARAVYTRGDESIQAEAYFFKSDASAFEARQRFPSAGAAAIHHGHVFVVCTSPQPGEAIDKRRALFEFAGALEFAWLANGR